MVNTNSSYNCKILTHLVKKIKLTKDLICLNPQIVRGHCNLGTHRHVCWDVDELKSVKLHQTAREIYPAKTWFWSAKFPAFSQLLFFCFLSYFCIFLNLFVFLLCFPFYSMYNFFADRHSFVIPKSQTKLNSYLNLNLKFSLHNYSKTKKMHFSFFSVLDLAFREYMDLDKTGRRSNQSFSLCLHRIETD